MPTRRAFLKTAGLTSLGFFGLRSLLQHPLGAALEPSSRVGFGALLSDPEGVLDLPRGFSYRVISRRGERMADGLLVPGMHDGMAAFPGPNGRTLLVRNHEIESSWKQHSPFGPEMEGLKAIPRDRLYDWGEGIQPSLGGTTTLVYNTERQELETHFMSLAGTERNCAGGPTPWGTWITCEEVNEKPEKHAEQPHGYNFEVRPSAQVGLVDPIPLKAMGRFRHEAVAVEPTSGVVYQTEDLFDGLLYRFVPEVPGQLAGGGRLQALAIKGREGADTRNWEGSEPFPVGKAFEVEWLDMEGIDNPNNDLRRRGHAAGAAVFARGEGAVWARDSAFFMMTNGGSGLLGQVFRYRPGPYEGTPREAEAPGTLELFIEPNNSELLRNGDNIAVAPWGDLVICEDTSGRNRTVGVTPQGQFYVIAAPSEGDSEMAGACFSPDGSTLFINVQKAGYTVAISGPWEQRHRAQG